MDKITVWRVPTTVPPVLLKQEFVQHAILPSLPQQQTLAYVMSVSL